MNNSAEQLLALQISQLEHDEFFHKEITRLNVHQRLNHMALHFAKYSGRVCDCVLNDSDQKALKKIIVDSFIISLTCANALNIRIFDKLVSPDTEGCKNLIDFGRLISRQLNVVLTDPLWLVKTYPIVVGQLAKACESVDHLEPYSYREAISDCIIRICALMLTAASTLDINLVEEVPQRLAEVKKKSLFYDYYISRRP